MLYNYLIASLEDLNLSSKPQLKEDELLALMDEQLTDNDKRLLALLRMENDAPEVVQAWEKKADDLEDCTLSKDDQLTAVRYELGEQCKNRFVSQWFAFNLNMNNVLAAEICRKHGFDVQKAVLGNNEVAEQLRKNSSAKDFGLAGMLPELPMILHLTEITNLMEREKAMDALRYEWLEEHTIFHNFEIENVLAYYLQFQLLHRWDNLTREKGEQVFRDLLAEMKKDIRFE